MILLKDTQAFDELTLINRKLRLNGDKSLQLLWYAIVDNNLDDKLDEIVSYEFPHGVEIDELTDFFKNGQQFIFKKLGIDPEEY